MVLHSTSYINGQVSFSEPFTMLLSPADCTLLLGGEVDSSDAGSLGNWYKGFISDFRISAGVVYGSSFSVPDNSK